jgi:hypothetical protein
MSNKESIFKPVSNKEFSLSSTPLPNASMSATTLLVAVLMNGSGDHQLSLLIMSFKNHQV